MFLCSWKINKKQHITMGKKIQYSGLALIIIAAIVLIASYFNG